MKYNIEERIGVNSVAKIFTEKLKWVFREQSINDFGIDAFVEITWGSSVSNDYTPTGELIGVQIKSGKSFFMEEKEDHFVFRGSEKHFVYWLRHSVNVVSEYGRRDTNIKTKGFRLANVVVINVLEEIIKQGHSESCSFDEVMQWLQNHEFYLNEEDCNRINKLNDSVSEKLKGGALRRLYEHFAPHPEMSDFYYKD